LTFGWGLRYNGFGSNPDAIQRPKLRSGESQRNTKAEKVFRNARRVLGSNQELAVETTKVTAESVLQV
jgi:hypothetical protein